MRVTGTLLAASAFGLSLFSLAAAQDSSTPGHDMSAMETTQTALPAACQNAPEPPAMGDMGAMQSAMEGMDEDQMAFMQGMMATQDPMMRGLMAEDTDVAFACAMIPHHQGAISMAEVELQYGDSDEMRALAERVIEDQRREIEELTQWIEAQQAQ